MVRCERCGWNFGAVRLVEGASCPRCRRRDGVSTPLATAPETGIEPGFIDLITEASRRLEGRKKAVPRV
jgi:hypothetical protein